MAIFCLEECLAELNDRVWNGSTGAGTHSSRQHPDLFLWHYFLCITVIPADYKQSSVDASSSGCQGTNTRYYLMATTICAFLETVQGDLLEITGQFLFSVLFVNDSFAGASLKNEARCAEHQLLLGQ